MLTGTEDDKSITKDYFTFKDNENRVTGKSEMKVYELYNPSPRLSDKPIYRYDRSTDEVTIPQYYPYLLFDLDNDGSIDNTFTIDEVTYDHVGDWEESSEVVLVVNS